MVALLVFKMVTFIELVLSDKRVSMGWWLLRLSAKILALLRLLVNISVTVNKKVKD